MCTRADSNRWRSTMNINDFMPEASKLGAAFVGSLISLNWLPGGCWRKARMLAAGTALSWYIAGPLAHWAGMNEGTTGLFLGLFGMALVEKVFELIAATQVADLFIEWLRKFLNLPPKPSKD